MQIMESRESLFTAMQNGATLITPNNRLSNQLLRDYFKQSASDVMDKSRCLPYQAFLRYLFKKARHLYPNLVHPVLFTAQQQRYLWQQILRQQQGRCNAGLLCEIQDAWKRCQHWHIDSHQGAFAHTPQTRQFQQWQQAFEQQLKQRSALTEEQLASHLLSYPDLFDRHTFIWVCFDDYTPEQRTLQRAMDEQGCQQYTYELAYQPTTTHIYPAKDTYDELLQMIQWLTYKLAAGERSIAVVVPDLQAQSHRLQRILQRHVSPQQFNISLGQPLIEYPLVAHALQWLGLDRCLFSNYQAHLLLHSPYLAGSQTEFIGRADAMQDSKVLQEPMIPRANLVLALNRTVPRLANLLNDLPDYPPEASASLWITHFKARLAHLGFPGEYPLNSSSYQCFQRFIMLFDEFMQLSVIKPLMSTSEALDALRDLATSTIFQAQKSTTPIQILGLLEASGCTFDSVWVSGLTDQCLPQKTNLSAYIPIDLQREYQMPHAVPERELILAEQLLQRLQNGSNDCVFSYPCLTGDIPNLPSPLISDFPTLLLDDKPSPGVTSCLIARTEHYVLPLTATEPVSGGTALLANQAKCPFRAFASHRLHAKSGLVVSDGPDASERGQIMHKIMDQLWRYLGSQQTLLTLTHDELQQRIESIILGALTPITRERSWSFPPLVQNVELSRLQRLVNACLEWEKQRPAFTVEAVEQDFTIALAGIDFRVRVDRLDRITSDKKWVIDYKTSIPINKPWHEERPEEPQLLLYALLDDSINALLFLQLKAGRIFCSGFSEENFPIQGMSTLHKEEHWSDRQQQWHRQLTQLANEFSEGHCAPQPYRSSTCQRCDFPNLCRIEHG